MTVTLDPSFVVTIGAAALAGNVVCLLLLLFSRPEARKVSSQQRERIGRACQAILAEAVGTFSLVFVAALVPSAGPSFALALGLIAAGLLTAFAHLDAGHCNPAVTVGLILAGRCHPVRAFFVVAAQCCGAIGAVFLLAWMLESAVGDAAPSPAENISFKVAFLLEATGAFVFVLVLAASTSGAKASPSGPVAIAGTLGALTLAIGPLTGAILNPARYLGAALFDFSVEPALIYLAGPCCGGAVAAVLVQMFLAPGRVEETSAEEGPVEHEEPEQRQAA